MASGPPVVGIDLGTTNSLVAYVDHTGRPTTVQNFEGDLLTPSKVLVEGNAAVVGREAWKAASMHPTQFAECFKRYMGEVYYPQDVDGWKWRPEMLSALVLKRLKNDAARFLGSVEQTVITVPAYFDDCRRRATKNAGVIAGWNVKDIINEPTAAAIAYAHKAGQIGSSSNETERLLVYDLGGGTFDTTILEVRGGREYRTIATEGEVRLGGHDWDERLCHYFAEQFKTKTGCDPLAEPHKRQGLIEFAQFAVTAKHALSVRKATEVPAMFQGHRTKLEVTRDVFEQLSADLLERTKTTTELVLEEAKMKWTDVHRVLLIGGSTRMPMVSRMLESMTGKKPDGTMSPDEAVAHGAAVYAHLHGSPNGARVINVNSHSYCVICRNRENKRVAFPLIPKNSPLPKQKSRLFPAPKAGMDTLTVRVCEGESEDPELCYMIGKVQVDGLPRDASKRWVIAVTLECHEDGNIGVSASVRDPEALDRVVQSVNATLVPSHGMSSAEIEQARHVLDKFELG